MSVLSQLKWWHLVIAAVCIVAIASFSGLFKGLKSIFGGAGDLAKGVFDGLMGNTDQAEQVTKDLEAEPQPGEAQMSISLAEANARANQSFEAMTGFGTDEDTVFRAVEGLNGYDLQAVRKAFGTKAYYGPWSTMDLFGWYSAELGEDDQARMRTVWENAVVPYV